MKRILLTVFGIAALAFVLSGGVFAQTGAGADQPATASPSDQAPPPADQAGNTGAPSGQSPATDTTMPASAAPAPADSGGSTPSAAHGSKREGSLPATASSNPLMALIGVIALAAFTILLVVRRRGAASS